MQSLSLEEQLDEENFDVELLEAIDVNVAPLLGDRRVPDQVITELGKSLQQGSWLNDTDSARLRQEERASSGLKKSKSKSKSKSTDEATYDGSTSDGLPVPRERFSYWCLNLLFLFCSDRNEGTPSVFIVVEGMKC